MFIDAPLRPGERVAISGASGMIGTALTDALRRDGCRVVRLVRSTAAREGEASWDPDTGYVDVARLEGVAAVVHLAGENIGQRWTSRVRASIYRSRVAGTRAIAEALASLRDRPRVLVAVSAVGYYGDRGDVLLGDAATPGDDFLAKTVRDWEAAAEAAGAAGIRVAHPRLGVVLSARGGALARMLPAFRLGLGGRLGSGKQWMSWISLTDVVAVVKFILVTPELAGSFNAAAPEPVRNDEFTRALGRVLERPTMMRIPAAALRLAFGEMAEQTLLASQRAHPERLCDAGFQFLHPRLEDALRAELVESARVV